MATDPSQLLMQVVGASGLGGQMYNDAVNNGLNRQQAQQSIDINKLKMAALQQQQKQQQAYQADVANYFKDPKPEVLASLIAKYPEQADAFKQSKAVLDEPVRQSQLTQFGQIHNAALNNRPDLLVKQISGLQQAEKAQGVDTSEVDDLLGQLQSSDPAAQQSALKQAQAFAQMHIAALDPKFAESLSKMGAGSTVDGKVVGKAIGHYEGGKWVVDYRDPDATPPRYEKVKNADGSESIVQVGGGDQASGGGGAYSGAPSGNIVDKIIGSESGGNPNARNPTPGQSASGLGQFTDKTWLNLYKQKYGTQGKSNSQILALKTDPAIGRQMTQYAVDDHAAALSGAGLPVTDPNIYMMHFLGPRAINVLKADPATPINRLVPPDSIKANPKILQGKTAGQVQQWAAQRMGSQPAQAGARAREVYRSQGTAPGSDDLTGDAYLATLPTGRANLIKAVLDGRAPAPKPGSRFGEQLAEDIAHADPSIDTTTLPMRQKARQDFTGNGRAAQVISSINRFAAHLNAAWENHLELGGPNLGPLSGIAAGISQSFDPKHVKAYNTEIEALQGEFQKLTKNGVGNEGEAERLMHNLRADQSEEGRAAALQALAKLAMAQIQPMHDQWSSAFGDRPIPVDITNSSRASLRNMIAGGSKALPVDRNGTPIPPPPSAAVDYLRQNPKLRSQFDAKYGQGAAARALGR